MADPVQLILDFLQRYQFSQAEEAFKAELIARTTGEEEKLSLSLFSEKSLDSDSQSWLPLSQGSNLNRDDWRMSSNVEENLVTNIRNPPEKQVFVTYESGKSEPQVELNTSLHQQFIFENVRAFSSSEPLVPHTGASASTSSDSLYIVDPIKPQGSLGGISAVKPLPVENRSCEITEQSSAFLKSEAMLVKKHSKKSFDSFASSGSQYQEHHLSNETGHEELDMCFEKTGITENARQKIKENKRQQDQSIAQNAVKFSMSNIPANETREDRKAMEENDLELRNGFMDASSGEVPSAKDYTLLPCSPLLRLSQSNEQQRGVIPVATFYTEQKHTIPRSSNHGEVQSLGQVVRSEEAKSLPNITGNVHGSGELPRLPPVRLHSIDKNMDIMKDPGSGADNENSTRSFASESAAGWADAPPLSQDMLISGLKRPMLRLSVSQGIVEDDMSEQLTGFATALDAQSERWYPDDYCDSDTWDDDDDPGYHRQPIEDEDWFLANEIDYPSDVERSRHPMDKSTLPDSKQPKRSEDDDDEQEGDSYFSGEEYYRSQTVKKDTYDTQRSEFKNGVNDIQGTHSDIYSRNARNGADLRSNDDGNNNDDHVFGSKNLTLMGAQLDWKSSMYEPYDLGQNDSDWGNSKIGHGIGGVSDDKNGSVKSGGAQASSDVADVGSSEADSESFRDQELIVYGSSQEKVDPEGFYNREEKRHVQVKNAPVQHFDEDEDDPDMILRYYSEEWCQSQSKRPEEDARSSIKLYSTNVQLKDKKLPSGKNKSVLDNGAFVFEGFSFPSPSRAESGDMVASRAESGKSAWSNRETTMQSEEEPDGRLVGPDNTLAAWKHKSDDSSPITGSCEEDIVNHSSTHLHSTNEYLSLEAREDGVEGLDEADQLQGVHQSSGQDEDVGQEEMRTFAAEEDQYETFNLRIIHRKNRTGFEEDKEFPVMINAVVAGRYHVTEYLGSAAFSKAIQAHDLHTGIDVCMKIIKNNKDFFDQSLDEIKLLKYINKHDPADKYHILRLYDYFYHREHLFIVCELLRANLYEFQKFNRESGGEVYFTMPRLQSITIQCLEALEFLHKLGIIHCDLKPENILVKSYSRCEIKIIDLGSSCFQTDHLCSYVQSRSYRAPEVILGHSYDQKIDIWSLGCILAELCTGNVLFQNDSLATLLARVVGILGPIDPEVLAKGRDTYKYFTKNHMLYERNQETDQLEYLLPKKTSLSHRLPMGDQGFIEFVGYLLQNNPAKRPSASEALQHPWLSYPYEPISS